MQKIYWHFMLIFCCMFFIGGVVYAGDLVIAGYTLVSKSKAGTSGYESTYKAIVINNGDYPAQNVTASLTGLPGSITAVDSNISFPDVQPRSSVISSDTFTLRQRRPAALPPLRLVWDISALYLYPDFTMNCTPDSLTLSQGSTTTMSCDFTSVNNFSGTITVSVVPQSAGLSAVPFAVSVSLSPQGTGRLHIAVNAESGMAPGGTAFTITASSDDKSHTFTQYVTIVETLSAPKVQIIYLVPADKEVDPQAVYGMERAIRHLQIWYQNALGLGKTFSLSYPAVRTYKTSQRAEWYTVYLNGTSNLFFWNNVTAEGFALSGGKFYDQDTLWIYYIDAEPSGDQLYGGAASVAVLPAHDVQGIGGKDPQQNICRWVGGLGHELGHAFGLPHPDPATDYFALMYGGYLSYPNAYLTGTDKSSLGNSPFFLPRAATNTLFDCSTLN
ncbi:MAG: hypothetical protein K8I29_00605 [Alphaproteobacteria bacterium]|uniref:Uncharacterized protein n=1 Tax=Candidatus Nitrobium versatile TaxID=2884831 RepID=A0A953LYT1_9BACT|nr:hypothetical protein [Candidatus Nitrobium versatile]